MHGRKLNIGSERAMRKTIGHALLLISGISLMFLGIYINMDVKLPRTSEVLALLSTGMGLILIINLARRRAT
jgi:hypothetical membrane protein